MRNVNTVSVLGGYMVNPQENGVDGKFFLGRFNAYCVIGGQAPLQTIPAYGVDEFLPAAGCPVNDLCYVTVEGPWLGTTSLTVAELSGDSSGAATVIQVGDVLENSTGGASSVATTALATSTAGRIASFSGGLTTVVAGKTLAFEIINRIGRALSALTTTSQTGVPLLMYFTKF